MSEATELGGQSKPLVLSRKALWALAALVLAVILEVAFYPNLAAFVTLSVLKEGGPGVEILFYRDVYVLPAAIVFLAATGVAAGFLRLRRPRGLVVLLRQAWVADIVLLTLSLWIYFAMTGAAEKFKG